ncbi:MAG: FecCD family ABC transporter permease [Rhodocyclaceae bacterium]
MELGIPQSRPSGTSSAGVFVLCAACILLLGLATVGALGFGDYPIPFGALTQVLLFGGASDRAFIIHELRLPRLLTGLLAGAGLGMAGAIVQSITRNPLGEPSLMGVTAGSAFAMVVCMTLFDLTAPVMLAWGTIGGLCAALLTFGISYRMRLEPLYLTLTGMSVNLFFAAAIIVLLVSSKVEANGIYYWLTGSLANRTWQHVHLLWPWALLGLGLGIGLARILDLLSLDDAVLASLGLRVQRWRLMLGLAAVILTAATVAATGPIAFIGLVSPHIVRFGLGQRGGTLGHARLLPLSALVGASLVCTTDLIAKWQEVPVGILCVLLGGPLLVHLINKRGS